LLPGDLHAERHAALATRTIAVDRARGLAHRAPEVAVVRLGRDARAAAAVAGAAARGRTQLPVAGAADAAICAADAAGAAIGVARARRVRRRTAGAGVARTIELREARCGAGEVRVLDARRGCRRQEANVEAAARDVRCAVRWTVARHRTEVAEAFDRARL